MPIRDLFGEAARVIDGADHRNAGGPAGGHVVFAEARRHVDDPGAVFGVDEVGGQDAKGALGLGKEWKERPVSSIDEFAAFESAYSLGLCQFLFKFPGGFLGQNHEAIPKAINRVIDVASHGEGKIRGQGPGCCRPGEQVHGARIPGLGGEFEAHGDGGILAFAIGIVQPGLVQGKRRLRGPGVGHDLVVLVEQPFLVQLLDGPDQTLHVGKIEGLVVILEIHPARRSVDVSLPFLGVLHHRLPAVIVEAVDPEFHDRGATGNPELLLGFHFRGQAVAVPAEAAFHPAPAQGLVARNDGLDVAGDQVSVVGQTIREGRSVVEDVLVTSLLPRIASVHGFLKGGVFAPAREDALFEFREVRLRVNIRVGVVGDGFGQWVSLRGSRLKGLSANGAVYFGAVYFRAVY